MHYLSKQLKVHLLCSCFNSTSIKNVWLFSTMRTFKIAHVLDQPKYLLENKVKFSFPYCKGTEIVNSYIITINRLKWNYFSALKCSDPYRYMDFLKHVRTSSSIYQCNILRCWDNYSSCYHHHEVNEVAGKNYKGNRIV